MRKLIMVASFAFSLLATAAFADDAQSCWRNVSLGQYGLALQPCAAAAEQGNARAQNTLGVMYQEGWGVAQSNTEAVRWYRAAAEQGDEAAQTNLGVMYQQGLSVSQNYTKAVYWYRSAAEQGYELAQFALGALHAQGLGVERDFIQAYIWSNIAAANGYELAAELRNISAMQLTEQQIAEAQARAQRCLDSNYTHC